MMTQLELKNVSKFYQTTDIITTPVNNVNFTISDGDFISITGPSGAGKSTLLNILGFLDKPNEGDIFLKGEKVNDFSDRNLSKLRNLNIGFIFQSYHLINDLNVLENVELRLSYRNLSKKQIKELAIDSLKLVGLDHRLKHFPHQLSGGQRQRVAIARAIVGRPTLILADEPTGNLDSESSEVIITLLEKLNAENNTTIIMVTHDNELAKRAKKTFVYKDGAFLAKKEGI